MTSDSLQPAYFDQVYAANADPWLFETSDYERAKYAATLAALPGQEYDRAFEIGCSIGVLTAQLATRCRYLLAVDVADAALARSRERCAGLPQVDVQCMQVPNAVPPGGFDLIALSEVGYYWSLADLHRSLDWMFGALRSAGHLVLVHWTPVVADYPLTGDEVHETPTDGLAPRVGAIGLASATRATASMCSRPLERQPHAVHEPGCAA